MASAYSRQKSTTPMGARTIARKTTASWHPIGLHCPECQHFIPRPREPVEADEAVTDPVAVSTTRP